jgi:hypothetical protein
MRSRFLSTALLLGPALAHAQFHNQGMTQTPAVKTEYVDAKTGTNALPLVIGDCLWGNCRGERLVFATANEWHQNLVCYPCTGPHLPDTHWTVLFNNEPRADPRNPGPPDASLPRALPAQGLMGFETRRGDASLPNDARWRAHLALDFIEVDDPVPGGIPFLGFGEFTARGNRDRPLGYHNPSARTKPSILPFAARLWEAVPPTSGGSQPATLASYVWMLANWGTKPKAIFITLYHWNLQNSTPPAKPANYHFSWPITQSALYPGADIIYIDAEDMPFYCRFSVPALTLGTDRQYRIDLTGLFRCVSDRGLFTEPMPATKNIPVTQVLWANESTGIDGALWTDVHDQRIVARATRSAGAETKPSRAKATNERSIAAIRADIARQCAAAPSCAARASLAAAGRESELALPVERQPSRPDLLKTLPAPPSTSSPKP